MISELQGSSHSHQVLLSNHTEEIEKLKQEMLKTDKKFENLEKILEKQEKTIEKQSQKVENHEKLIENIKGETKHINQLCENNNKVIQEHSNEINMLKKFLTQNNNSSSGVSFPLEIIENLEKRIASVDTKHTENNEIVNKRLSDLEAAIKLINGNILKLTEDLSNIKKNLQNLDEKVNKKLDISDFEKYKSLRPSSDTQGNISNQYINIIEDLQKEIENIKKKIIEIPNLLRSLENLTKRVVDLEDKIKLKIDSTEVYHLISNLKMPDGTGKDPNIPYILKKLIELEQKIEALLKLSTNNKSGDDSEL